MIVVTTGTNEQPFDRIVAAAAALQVDEELLVQYGSSSITSGPGRWVDFMPFDELAAEAALARVVVCHAGVGSIMLAQRHGRRPIVVPRRHHLGEAVDDHQLPLARRLHAAGTVYLLEDADGLADAIATVSAEPWGSAAGDLPGPDALAADVRGALTRASRNRLRMRVAA